jgi:hypothetical protein
MRLKNKADLCEPAKSTLVSSGFSLGISAKKRVAISSKAAADEVYSRRQNHFSSTDVPGV